MNKLSLRNRILLPVLLLVALGLAASGITSFVSAKRSLVTGVTDQMTQLAQQTARTMDDWIIDQKEAVQVWAEEAAMEDASTGMEGAVAVAAARLAELNGHYDHVERINLLSMQGTVLATSKTETKGTADSFADRDYFKAAARGEATLSEALISRFSGNPVTVVAVPVKKGDAVVGVLTSIIDLASFNESVVKPIKVLESGYVYLFDRRGLFVTHPDPKKILNTSLNQYTWGQQMLAKPEGMVRYDWEGKAKWAAYVSCKNVAWSVAASATEEEMYASVVRMAWLNGGIAVGTLVGMAVVLLYIVRMIAGPLERVVTGLRSGATQMASNAGQISEGSHSLAESSSEQAASLEETSASLEEMSSMAKRNAENALQAAGVTREARNAAEVGQKDMTAMIEAMAAIKVSSEQIAKINKTIDEIAFQTNILALNAAVEAARAGDAGAGFAVVADEVRSLAQRSADAAREAGQMVNEAVDNAQRGVGLSAKVSKSLEVIVTKVRDVDHLVEDVATASREQDSGVRQLTTATAQMDQVTQTIAAAAEESASAAAELNNQAADLAGFVMQIDQLMKGAGDAEVTPPENAAPSISGQVAPREQRTLETAGTR